ncbi:MAG: hypothetical protein OEZ03_08290 [Alphaproteobacteria bacterium]|nr:hypothetical protein [Alphaproteobacteria bacterium]
MTRPLAIAALALLTGLMLAGCETKESPPTASETPSQPTTTIPYNGMTALPQGNGDPQHLMGLDRARLAEKLGKPALIRRDGDAEVWQYRADRCVLDLFLYGTDKKVEHVDLRDRGNGGENSLRDCFIGMQRRTLPNT